MALTHHRCCSCFARRASDASPIESTWDRVVDSFDEMGLSSELLRGIYGYGFEKPSAIQQRAILPCIAGDFFFWGGGQSVYFLMGRNINFCTSQNEISFFVE